MAAMVFLGIFVCLLFTGMTVTVLGIADENETICAMGVFLSWAGLIIGLVWWAANGRHLYWG